MKNIVWEHYIWDEGHDATSEQVKLVEEKLKIHFPEDYLDVAMKEHGKAPQPCVITVGSGSTCINNLLHFEIDSNDRDNYMYSIIRKHELLKDDQNPLIIPFAKAGGASVFCFDYRKSNKSPTVIFVDSDYEGEEAIHTIAKNFTEFLSMLEE